VTSQFPTFVSRRSSASLPIIRLMVLATQLISVLHAGFRTACHSFLNPVYISADSRDQVDRNSRFVCRSVKLLPGFDNTVIPGFSVLEFHDQDFYSFLNTYVFRNGASSSTKEGSTLLCRRCVCWTAVSARVYTHRHGIRVTMESVHRLSLHYTK
jgi:hypothetical protein